MSKCKFKVGDYVISNTHFLMGITIGSVGKVVEVISNNRIRVNFKCGTIGADVRYFDLCIGDQPDKIVITTDGKTTTAKMYRGKTLVKVESAECHPHDRFDFMVGAKIAFNRLVGTPTGTCVEEPKYYNGKVVCVDANKRLYCTTGKIYQIVDGVFTDDDGDRFDGIQSFTDFQAKSYAKWLEVVE